MKPASVAFQEFAFLPEVFSGPYRDRALALLALSSTSGLIADLCEGAWHRELDIECHDKGLKEALSRARISKRLLGKGCYFPTVNRKDRLHYLQEISRLHAEWPLASVSVVDPTPASMKESLPRSCVVPKLSAAELQDHSGQSQGVYSRTIEGRRHLLANLARYSKAVRYVDPYLSATSSFLAPLRDLLLEIKRSNVAARNGLFKEFSVHFSSSKKGDTNRIQLLKESLCELRDLPFSVSLFDWVENGVADFHDRYVLCDFGGVEFPRGLDVNLRGTEKNPDRWIALDRESHGDLWFRFSPESKAYKLLRREPPV